MWVELRRDLRCVKRSEVAQRLDEVPYRLFRLATGSDDENYKNAVADIVAFAKKRKDESQDFVSCFQRGIFLLAVVLGVLGYLSGGTPWKNQIGNMCVPPFFFM